MELFETIKYPPPKCDAVLIKQFGEIEDAVNRLMVDLQDSAYWRGVEVGLQYAREHGWTDTRTSANCEKCSPAPHNAKMLYPFACYIHGVARGWISTSATDEATK